jgi:peroxiredoxin
METISGRFRAPEIYGDYWFNADPIPIQALQGYVILIDFWDYTSQACTRSIVNVREWVKRYRDLGLVTVGVHTPEFPFGRDPVNVRAAIDRMGIGYPVVMDNDYIIWGAYRAREWPTKFLIDRNTHIRYIHGGEGSNFNIEQAIQSLIVETGYHGDLPIPLESPYDGIRSGTALYKATPKILSGWQRGSVGNIEGNAPESTARYRDPGYYLEGRVYVDGEWFLSRQFIRHDDGESKPGSLIVSYQGARVNLIVKPEGEKDFQVFVKVDDAWLNRANAGSDIRIDEEGRSYFLADVARNYSIVRHKEFGAHVLRLTARSNGFALYALEFTSTVIGEPLPAH